MVLADASMPEWTGLQVLAHLQEQGPGIPFILVAKNLKAEMTDEYMRKGAPTASIRLAWYVCPLPWQSRWSERPEQQNNPGSKMSSDSEAHYHALVRKSYLWHLPV